FIELHHPPLGQWLLETAGPAHIKAACGPREPQLQPPKLTHSQGGALSRTPLQECVGARVGWEKNTSPGPGPPNTTTDAPLEPDAQIRSICSIRIVGTQGWTAFTVGISVMNPALPLLDPPTLTYTIILTAR